MKRVDFKRVKTYSLKARHSKVHKADFASPGKKGISFRKFYQSMPNILAAKQIRRLTSEIVTARKKKKAVIFMLGAHVIKCGLSPLIINLMKRKVITAVALNGAGIIHDTELAMVGSTSEDVGLALKNGSFGMARETADFINIAIDKGVRKGVGIGRVVGERIRKANLPLSRISILAAGIKYKVPITVHVAMGTDIIHQHPSCNGAAVGEGSLVDFRNLVYSIINLNDGGVAINFGSAIILPEVFLKAVNVARNIGHEVKDFTTANFDMIAHYRPCENIIKRPTADGGWGCNIIGHHEIMI
ncbi:MAG: hypothetical protein ABH875_05650, partial [Candidatus Omnitrophota bacterium]